MEMNINEIVLKEIIVPEYMLNVQCNKNQFNNQVCTLK